MLGINHALHVSVLCYVTVTALNIKQTKDGYLFLGTRALRILAKNIMPSKVDVLRNSEKLQAVIRVIGVIAMIPPWSNMRWNFMILIYKLLSF